MNYLMCCEERRHFQTKLNLAIKTPNIKHIRTLWIILSGFRFRVNMSSI